MTNEDDQRIFKGGHFTLAQRLHHLLKDEANQHRALVWLVIHLHEEQIMSDDDIDAMLRAAVGSNG